MSKETPSLLKKGADFVFRPVRDIGGAVTPEVKIQGMERVTKKLTKYGKPIAITMLILIIIAFIIMVIAAANLKQNKTIVNALTGREENKTEPFADMMYPKAKDAETSGDFDTLQRECEPGLTKCLKPMSGGNGVTMWCSSEKNCVNKQLNLKGTPIKEPMYWNTRFA